LIPLLIVCLEAVICLREISSYFHCLLFYHDSLPLSFNINRTGDGNISV